MEMTPDVQTAEAALTDFLAALRGALREALPDASEFRNVLSRLEAAMPERQAISEIRPSRRPACDCLPPCYAALADAPDALSQLSLAFQALEPSLPWVSEVGKNAPEGLREAYADAMIVGPGGLAESDALEIGVSVMASHRTYPDHRHPPEELYIALSEGEWRQNADPWVSPGMGGLIYNPPGITHAMRSGDKPFLAIWCLPLP
jgi:quercetin dioxygenase-like cupin family protein